MSDAPHADLPPVDDVRAPPTAAWRTLTPAQRTAVLERLGPMPAELSPPTGDPHINAERAAEDALERWFRTRRIRVYVGRGITAYYPDEPRFKPDLFVVFDVEPGERVSWVVDQEGRGLDFVLEIHFRGDRQKDAERNVERYARLGIPEYFLYDVGRQRLQGWRLAPERGTYAPIVPQRGEWRSEVLDMELSLSGGQLRFLVAGAVLPLGREIAARLAESLDAAERRAREAEQRVGEAEQRAQDEATARAALADELERVRAELAALKQKD